MPVEVKGVIGLRKALRAYAPDLAKELNREMGAALKPIVSKARSYLPSNSQVLSGWQGREGRNQGKFPQYDSSLARKGITYKTSPSRANRRGFKSLATIFNKTAAGAIYETAGRKNPAGRPQGKFETITINSSNPEIGTYSYITSTGKNFGKSNNPNAGQQFINSMGKIYKTTRAEGQRGRVGRKMNGRVIYRAWGEDQGRTTAAVMKAIERAAAKLQARSKVQ